MMKYLYRIYQLFIAVPIMVVWTIIIALIVIIGCTIGSGHFWGYHPGKWWAWFTLKLFLLPVKVEGRDKVEKGQSYVFVANHQGAFDIFLIYGHLRRNFKWMMKYQLLKIPFVGLACKKAHHIMIDKRGPRRIKESYDQARKVLQDGISLMVFPEGARTMTGHMAPFKRGAFSLADELQLPVVPITINGSFHVMPRMRDWHFVNWHPLSLTFHDPIYPKGKGAENITETMDESLNAIMSSLEPQFQGVEENPDQ